MGLRLGNWCLSAEKIPTMVSKYALFKEFYHDNVAGILFDVVRLIPRLLGKVSMWSRSMSLIRAVSTFSVAVLLFTSSPFSLILLALSP